MSGILTPILAALASFVGAWLAAQFALRRFYREKVWERKAEAYTIIFEALHEMRERFDFKYHAEIAQREVNEEQDKEAVETYRTARATLYRTLARQTWVLSEESQQLLKELDLTLNKARESYIEIYEHGLAAVEETIAQLKQFAKRDLELTAGWLRFWPNNFSTPRT